jgi:hypothetical protein
MGAAQHGGKLGHYRSVVENGFLTYKGVLDFNDSIVVDMQGQVFHSWLNKKIGFCLEARYNCRLPYKVPQALFAVGNRNAFPPCRIFILPRRNRRDGRNEMNDTPGGKSNTCSASGLGM